MNPRLHSSLEPLEHRIAPAGIVTVSVGGGSVKITGDADANEITLSFSDALVTVQGNNGTTVKLATESVASGSRTVPYRKDLTVALGDGADTLTVGDNSYFGNVTFDLGAGVNSVSLGKTFVPGSLKILAKSGPDSLEVTSPGTDFEVGRDFTVALGDGGVLSNLTAGRLIVGGKFSIIGGKDLEDFAWSFTDLVVGGDVNVLTGKDLDQVSLNASGDVGIGGKLTVKGGDSVPPPVPAIFSASLGVQAGDELTVRGAVSITTVAGISAVDLGGANKSTFAKGVAIKAGAGETTITMAGKSQTIMGSLNVSSSGVTSFAMEPESFFINGDFIYKGGKAKDTFKLEGKGVITGKLSVDLGDADNQSITIGSSTASDITVFGDVTSKQSAKAGSSFTTIQRLAALRKLTITTGDTADTITLDNIGVGGAATFSFGGGGDALSIEESGFTNKSLFVGPLKVSMGKGDDTARFGANSAANQVDILRPALFDGGEGTNDQLFFNGRGNTGVAPTVIGFEQQSQSM